jgi:hypothetical protein
LGELHNDLVSRRFGLGHEMGVRAGRGANRIAASVLRDWPRPEPGDHRITNANRHVVGESLWILDQGQPILGKQLISLGTKKLTGVVVLAPWLPQGDPNQMREL